MRRNSSQEMTFGYLSLLHSAEHGYFGGYLIVSAMGRPLEFHCSAPVRPTRAQEILYGPTLQPFLLGDQIGATLLCQAKLSPRLVLANHEAPFCLRSQIAIPLARLVIDGTSDELNPMPAAVEGAGRSIGTLHGDDLVIGNCRFELPPGFASDREVVAELLTQLSAQVDLAEPFSRIHEAILEAQRIGDRGPDSHGQAA